MSDNVMLIVGWLGQSLAVGGGLLLLAAALMLIQRQPVRRRFIGAAAVRIALLVPLFVIGPKWLLIPLPEQPAEAAQPAPALPPETARVSEPLAAPPATVHEPGSRFTYVIIPAAPPAIEPAPPIVPVPTTPAAAEPAASPEPPRPFPWRPVLIGGYVLLAGALLARWLLAQLALVHVLRRSRPAGRELTNLFERVAARGGFVPQLRVVPDVTGPVCCGLWRPVVLLPQRLAESADEESLRWIFAHELAHLRRGDAWTAFWFGLAAALYFPLPWFWWLKRQVALCQEFVADAEASAEARPEEYAAFLVNLSRSAHRRRRLAAASGVLGSPSELYRRITMLLKNTQRVDQACPRRWSLLATGAFLSLAILLSGIGVTRQTAAAPLDTPKEDQKADKKPAAKDKDEPKKDKDPEEKFIRPRGDFRVQPLVPGPNGLDPEQLQKHIQKMMEELQKNFADGNFRHGAMVFPQFGNNNPFAVGRGSNGRLGAMIEKPQAALVEQLDLPRDQGIVLAEIQNDSAAAKAGLKANDILLELNGKPVSSDPAEFRKQLADIKANTTVEAVVLRKGKRETIKNLRLPEAGPEGANAFDFGIPVPQIAPIPEIPRFNLPDFKNFGPGVGAGATSSMSVTIANDNFTIHSKDEALDITVGGRIEDGARTVNQVTIVDGKDRHSYDNMKNVPEKYRARIDALLKNVHVSGK